MMLRVERVTAETLDTKTLAFDVDASFTYKPGQFVMVGVPVLRDGKEQVVRRAYSLSSTPTQPGSITITVKAYPDGLCSPKLCSLVAGDQVDVTGPFGIFFLEHATRDTVFLAAGSGVAPFRGMILFLLDSQPDANITLLYSEKTKKDIVFYDEFKRLARKFPNFRYHVTLTRIAADEPWNGLRGRISEQLIRQTVPDLHGPHYFLCGSREMVKGTVEILISMGVSKESIKKEVW